MTILMLILFPSISLCESSIEGFVNSLREIMGKKEKLIKQIKPGVLDKISTSFDNYKETSKFHKLDGIRDETFQKFLNFYLSTKKVPSKYCEQIELELVKLTHEKSNDWKQYKFMYKNEETSETLFSAIFAQHDHEASKVNWIYVELLASFTVNDVFALTTTDIVNGEVKEKVSFFTKPREFDGDDIRAVMAYYDVMVYKLIAYRLDIPTAIDDSESLEFLHKK